MTTTTTDIPSPRSQAIDRALSEKFEHVPIELIRPSATNPRHHFDDGYLADLANSVRERGVLQPILVRPLPPTTAKGTGHLSNRYEIVAGECRYRASKLAGLTHLPTVIRAYSDEQAREVQLIENIHRQDLTPLEQAKGYRALITTNPDKHRAATIAARVGMSEAWVWDRLKLNDLVPEAQQLLEQDRITVGHAILIARLKPGDQTRVVTPRQQNRSRHSRDALWQFDGGRLELDERRNGDRYADLKPVSVRELDAWIRQHIRFDVEHAAKAQPLVFEDTAAVVAQATAQPGRGKKVIAITHEYRVADDARDEGERTYGSQSWVRADGQAKSKTCEHAVLGVVVAGRGQGETLQVCIARDRCVTHWKESVQAKEKAAKLRERGKGKAAAKVEKTAEDREAKQRAHERAQEELAQRTWTAVVPEFDAAALDRIKAMPMRQVIDRVIRRSRFSRALTALCGKRQPRTADEALRVLALDDVIGRLPNTWKYDRAHTTKVLRALGIDVAAVLKRHEVAKPGTPVKAKKGRAA